MVGTSPALGARALRAFATSQSYEKNLVTGALNGHSPGLSKTARS